MAESIRLSELPLLDTRESARQVGTGIYEVLFDFRTNRHCQETSPPLTCVLKAPCAADKIRQEITFWLCSFQLLSLIGNF